VRCYKLNCICFLIYAIEIIQFEEYQEKRRFLRPISTKRLVSFSVSKVPSYGLEDQGSILAQGRDSSLCHYVQTYSGAHSRLSSVRLNNAWTLAFTLTRVFITWFLNMATDILRLPQLIIIIIIVPGYRSRGPGFDSRTTIFSEKYGSGTESTQPREYN
jgi:hypothetical protein